MDPTDDQSESATGLLITTMDNAPAIKNTIKTYRDAIETPEGLALERGHRTTNSATQGDEYVVGNR